MSGSLTAVVTRRAVGVLLAALAVSGVGTGVLLHARARASLDAALLAAAYGEAHPWSEERWSNDAASSPVDVHVWQPGDALVDEATARQAEEDEAPRYLDVGSLRVLLMVVEPLDAAQADDEAHPHQLVVASAPAVRLRATVVPFAFGWGLMSVVVGGVAWASLVWSIRAAMEPLRIASRDLAALRGLGRGVRLQGGGHEEIDVVLGSVNDLLGRLEAAFDSQSRFTAEAAHELRTPVTVMLGELDLALRRERDVEGYRQTLRRVRDDTLRLRERVEGLMALARVDAGQAEATRELEHVSGLVHAALRAEHGALDRAGVTVEVIDGADPEVDVHASLVTMALGNLLRNVAVHAPGAQVTVRTEARGDRVDVVVDDDGPGVPPGDRSAVFDRFHRGDRRRDGLGLGLPLAREIARRHGGDLVLEAAPTGGCRARLTLRSGDSHRIPMSA